GPFRIETLRMPAGLLRVRNIFGIVNEPAELADGDFGATHPESVLHTHRPWLLALIRFAFRSGLSAPFDARGPTLLIRRTAHHEFARRYVDRFQHDAAPQFASMHGTLFRLVGM